MKKTHFIHPDYLELHKIREITKKNYSLALSEESKERITHCRSYLEKKLEESEAAFYGINTGFGSLYNVRISKSETEQLQHNLVMSHACGTGDEVPQDVVRLMLLLKIQSLSYGYSGIRTALVERLIYFYNQDILPVIYQQGSLGASGDLAPLAHLSLPLIGLGEVYYQDQKQPSAKVLESLAISPLRLQAKEGLAMLNGTQFSTAYAVWCMLQADSLFEMATHAAALSVDAFNCHWSPFEARLHQIRPHSGQQKVAADICELLRDSPLYQSEKEHVQDPYAFRCIPQVHGASWDALQYIKGVVMTEANSVTDNPNIFPDDDLILSGGNFHAQPIALVLDHLAIALAELGSISERRVYQLISGNRGLPAFLVRRPGINSGLMIPQYTAASIVSQNKQLCTPASIDSIVSSNGQEDHVSMAANAATKAYRVVENLERLLAIEWMTAAQALAFRRPLHTSPQLEKLIEKYRNLVPVLEEDRILSEDIHKTIRFIQSLEQKRSL
ncbi:MAG: histidine ammonia-lyase [Saprospiraceae bacterium]|nr:MAG: histidine ammonia-lyase [Saprospiraceae bacterium]